VRQQCDALAELLVTQGKVLLDFAEGAALGARAGWSIERVHRLKQERDALNQALAQQVPAGNEERWSCQGVELGNAFMSQRVQLRELGAAQEAFARSGESVQDLARKQAEVVEKLLQEARQRQPQTPIESVP
jgi:hypothetical protein